MPWFKIDDAWHSHPKVREAGNAAAGLWVRIGSYCSQYVTEGFIRASVVHEFGTKREIEKLLNVGLLAKVEGGYQIPDFLEFNPSAEEVKAQRKASAERQRTWREKKAAEREAAHDDRQSNAVTNAVSNAVTNTTPSRPVPSRPENTPLSSSKRLELVPAQQDDDGGRFLESIIQFIASERLQGRNPINPAGYRATVVDDLRTAHRPALELMLRNCPWLNTPMAAAAHYQARPELHPKAIA